jgi:major intracellular serine protease
VAKLDTEAPKYLVVFKPKDRRPNQRDDKLELFRSIIGLEDIRDILDLQYYKGGHMTDPLPQKTPTTVTDNNAYDMPVIAARLTKEQVSRLIRDPNVDSVQPERFMYSAQEPGPVQGQQVIPWGYTKVRAKQAWDISGKKGDGVTVAVLDTGCDATHSELRTAVKVNQNFTERTGTNAEDPVQHGTHVCGTICMAHDSQGFVGVAPNATVWNLRAGDHQGIFSSIDIWEALEYARNNNAMIVNMSIAGGNIDPPNEARRESMRRGFDEKGMIYMVALGNNGNPSSNVSPSDYYGAFGISNLAKDNNLSATSNSGVNTDFTFPGRDIWSTANGGLWRMLDGTSMATPHASGVAALALSVFNDKGCPPYGAGIKKNKVVGGAFRLAVDKLGKFTTERDNRYGYGLPLADKVVRAMMGMSLS